MTREEWAFLFTLATPLIYYLGGALTGPIVARVWWDALQERFGWGDYRPQPTPEAPQGQPAGPSPTPQPARPAIAEGIRWLLVGSPGSGKTALARFFARRFVARGAEVLVLDIEGERWPRGCRMRGAPDDYPVVAAELKRVAAVATERRGAFQRGERVFPPLVVIVDELPRVLTGVRGATELLTDLCLRGRKLNISLIALTQATGAKLTGLEGKTELLRQFRRFDVRRADRTDGEEPGRFVIVSEGGVDTWDLKLEAETDLVLPIAEEAPAPAADEILAAALAAPVAPAARRPPAPVVAAPRPAVALAPQAGGPLLAAGGAALPTIALPGPVAALAVPAPGPAVSAPVAVPVLPASGPALLAPRPVAAPAGTPSAAGTPDQGPAPVPAAAAEAGDEVGDEADGGGFDAETIRALAAAGWSRNKIASKLRGTKAKRLRVIAEALGEA